MANFFETIARKLGMRPPPQPRPVPPLLTEGEFGPLAGQPVATTGVPTFDVLGLGLVDAELLKAKDRLVANRRKMGGEAIRAQQFADAIAGPILSVERQSEHPPPDELPEEPDPIPRQVVLAAYDKKQREIEAWKKSYPAQLAAQQKAAQESAMLISKHGEAGYAAIMQARAAAEASKKAEREKWTALANAGDPAGKAWIEWQKALGQTNYTKAKWDGQVRYGNKSPEALTEQARLATEYYELKKWSDAWGKKFQELRILRDQWIAQQQLAQGKHPSQLRYAELVRLRAASRTSPPTHHFTVNENVEQQKLYNQLLNLGMTKEQIAALGAG